MFGHMAKFCRIHKRCTNCGSEEHDATNCIAELKCSNCHSHNERFKSTYDTRHGVRDKCCQVYENEVVNLRLRINYGRSE